MSTLKYTNGIQDATRKNVNVYGFKNGTLAQKSSDLIGKGTMKDLLRENHLAHKMLEMMRERGWHWSVDQQGIVQAVWVKGSLETTPACDDRRDGVAELMAAEREDETVTYPKKKVANRK